MPLQHALRCWSCVLPTCNDLRLWVCIACLRRSIIVRLLLLLIQDNALWYMTVYMTIHDNTWQYTVKTICILFYRKKRKACELICQIWHVCDIFVSKKLPASQCMWQIVKKRKTCELICHKIMTHIWYVCDIFVTQKTTSQSVRVEGCLVECVFFCKNVTGRI